MKPQISVVAAFVILTAALLGAAEPVLSAEHSSDSRAGDEAARNTHEGARSLNSFSGIEFSTLPAWEELSTKDRQMLEQLLPKAGLRYYLMYGFAAREKLERPGPEGAELVLVGQNYEELCGHLGESWLQMSGEDLVTLLTDADEWRRAAGAGEERAKGFTELNRDRLESFRNDLSLGGAALSVLDRPEETEQNYLMQRWLTESEAEAYREANPSELSRESLQTGEFAPVLIEIARDGEVIFRKVMQLREPELACGQSPRTQAPQNGES